MNKNRIRLMIASALVSISLLLSACGGSATPTPTPTPRPIVTPTSAVLMPTPNGTENMPAAVSTDQAAPEAQPTGNP